MLEFIQVEAEFCSDIQRHYLNKVNFKVELKSKGS